MRTERWIILASLWAVVAGGCARMNRNPADCFLPETDVERYEHGLVVCLSGAGGMMGETGNIRQGLIDGGVECAIEVFDWSTGVVLIDQMDLEANKRKARALARRVEEYQQGYPGRPVHLVGVSAGTGLIVWALEDLAPGCHVESAFLIAPSLWHKYDLSDAMRELEGRLYTFYSPWDPVLALLVPVFGTVDRINGVSGGLGGFSPPDKADGRTKAVYESKLEQIGWESEDAVYGHIGGHLGATQPAYVSARIAPLLNRGAPATDTVGSSVAGRARRHAVMVALGPL